MLDHIHAIVPRSADENYAGAAFLTNAAHNVSIIGTIAGATNLRGTLFLDASNKAAVNGTHEPPEISWTVIDSVPLRGNGTDGVVAIFCACRWMRARWVYESGTGGTIEVHAQINDA